MATLSEIYDWFMTGKKPTQAQFWASWGSFWNKSEAIPQSAITNLISTLNSKAEKSQFDAHKTDINAHSELFAKVKIYGPGQLQIFKTNPEGNPAILEIGDFVIGIVNGKLIRGVYLGGNIANLESYNIIDYIDF
jgi:hypothetical protein